ncbi:MAG: hypothetical protein NC418_02285 [Muribaculaceae bacterium]|nr:hypothetical protein [Muribaculaceae bacterium]
MAGETDKQPELTLDEQAMFDLLVEANAVQRGTAVTITIDGKSWHIRPTSMRQNLKMLNLDFDIRYWQNRLKEDGISHQEAKRINTKIRKAYAKKAAHKVLGKRLWLIPGAFALMWRRIYNGSEKVSATLNSEEAIGENKSFYLANLGSSKRALVLSTMQVGEAVKQLQERKASAESMLDEDASPKKEADSKSAARSKHRPTTRR